MNRIKIAIGVSVAILIGLLIAVFVLWSRPTAEDLKNSQAETALQKQRADSLDAKLKACEAKPLVVSTGPATQPQGPGAGNGSDAYHFLLGDKLGGIANELSEVRKHQQYREIIRSSAKHAAPSSQGGQRQQPASGSVPSAAPQQQGNPSCQVLDNGKVVADFLATGSINPLGKLVTTGAECRAARAKYVTDHPNLKVQKVEDLTR